MAQQRAAASPGYFRPITKRQREVLDAVIAACLDPNHECTGACDAGWLRVEGHDLVVANNLQKHELVALAFGSTRRAVHAHVTQLGRLVR